MPIRDSHPYLITGIIVYALIFVISMLAIVALPDPTSAVWVLASLLLLGVPITYVVGQRLT